MSTIDLMPIDDSDGEEEIKHEEVSDGTPSDERVQVKDEVKKEEDEEEDDDDEEEDKEGEDDESAEEPPDELDGEKYMETVLPNGCIVPNFMEVNGVRERWNPEWDPLPPRVPPEDEDDAVYINDVDEFIEWLWKEKRKKLASQGIIVDLCKHKPYCKSCPMIKPIQKRAAEAADYEKSTLDGLPTEVDAPETTNTNGVPEIDDDLKQETESFQRLGVNESVKDF